MLELALILTVAFLLALSLTSTMRWLAPKVGLLDRPDGQRKLHDRPIPLGGGVAIFLAVSLSLAAAFIFPNPWRGALRSELQSLVALFFAALVIVAVGLLDDRRGIRGRQKLVGQIVATLILIASGTLIEHVRIFQWDIDLGLLAFPVTVCWLLGAINSLNLIDGVDGLATTIGCIVSVTMGVMALLTGHESAAIVAFVFAACLLGFLRFNFPPASIFLGDSGSMLIGLVVGTAAIVGSLKGAGTVLLVAPVAALTIPFFDVGAAIIRRKLTGRSIYSTDRAHLHHRLLDLLGSNWKVVAWLAACSAGTCVAALFSVYLRNDLIGILALSALVVVMIATRIFGHVELQLLTRQVKSVGFSLIHTTKPRETRIRETAGHDQVGQWDRLWYEITETADRLQFNEVRLDIDSRGAQHDYHASWQRSAVENVDRLWRVNFPLTAGSRVVGRLSILGERNGESMSEQLEQVRSLLEGFDHRLADLLNQPSLPIANLAGPAVSALNLEKSN